MLLLSAMLAICLQSGEAPLDTLTLKGGKELRGIILYVDDKSVILGQKTTERQIKRVSVVKMEGPRAMFSTYKEHLQLVYSARATAEQAIALAEWCSAQGYPRDIKLHYWRALELDAENREAHIQLGHREQSGAWTVPTGKGSWASLERLEERKQKDQEPWEFTTAHFELNAVTTLHDALRTAASLEIYYFHFFQMLQTMGGFYELRKPMEVWIYQDIESGYPSIGSGIQGYFDVGSGITHTWLEKGELKNGVRILTHALQYKAVQERSKGEPSDYPGWLWEGLATYFESSYLPTDGVPDYLPERLHGGWVHAHASGEKKKLRELDDMLVFDRNAMGDAKDTQLLYAQAYTLVYFLLHSEDLSTLQSFKEYLHYAFRNQGSGSKFRKAFGKSQRKALQKKWSDFVEKSDLRLRQ